MIASSLPVRYRLDGGTPVISVTQVLSLTGQIDDAWFTPASARRGSLVHALTEDIDAGRSFDAPDDVNGYLDAYRAFKETVRPDYIASELQVTRADMNLGGTIDRVCANLFGASAILDFKTGPPYPWHPLQLAAYRAMEPVATRWACYLQPNGRYKLKQYDDPQDHAWFMYYLAQVHERGYQISDNAWVIR